MSIIPPMSVVKTVCIEVIVQSKIRILFVVAMIVFFSELLMLNINIIWSFIFLIDSMVLDADRIYRLLSFSEY
jgi:hypothetical protein